MKGSILLNDEERRWIIDFLEKINSITYEETILVTMLEKLRGKTFEYATAILGAIAGDVAYDVSSLRYKKIYPYVLMSMIYLAIINALDKYADKTNIKGKDRFMSEEFNKFLKTLDQMYSESRELYEKIKRIYYSNEFEATYNELVSILKNESTNVCGTESYVQTRCYYSMVTLLLTNIVLEAYENLKTKGLTEFMVYVLSAALEHTMADKDLDEEFEEIIEKSIENFDQVAELTWDLLRIAEGGGLLTFEQTSTGLHFDREENVHPEINEKPLHFYAMAIQELKEAYNLVISATKRLRVLGFILLVIPIIIGIVMFIYWVLTSPYASKNIGWALTWLPLAILVGPFFNFIFIGLGIGLIVLSIRYRRPAKTIKRSIDALEKMSSKFDPIKIMAVSNELRLLSLNPSAIHFIGSKFIEASQRIELALEYLRKAVELER